MRRASIVGLAAALSIAAAGCGGGSGANDKQVAAITHTFDSYIAAIQRGDGKAACSLLTPAYQKRAAHLATPSRKPQVKGASCAEAISKGTLSVLKKFHPSLERVQVKGNRASGFQPGQGIFQPQKTFFARTNGKWRISNTIYAKGAPKSRG
jgi:hypothetical protein